ncbi:MAG: 30S ribosomal protein S20 [Gammaproteobacteria bacterium]|nr:30S ribosomal protein S20 [Gammaproteobacteria bacterium]
MANSPQAKKRARQAEDRRQRNVGQRSKMRTFVKKVRAAIATGNKEAAQAAFAAAAPVLDSMTNRGILHKNTAARYKSRLNDSIRAM